MLSFSIYKFRFPFLEQNHEAAIYSEIKSEFRRQLLYLDVFEKDENISRETYLGTRMCFQMGYCDFYFGEGSDDFSPVYICELSFSSGADTGELSHILFKIHQKYSLKYYIFEGISQDFLKVHQDIITPDILEHHFSEKAQSSIVTALRSMNKKYFSETLVSKTEIWYSLLYMVWVQYQSVLCGKQSQQQLREIDQIQNSELDPSHAGALLLSSQRLQQSYAQQESQIQEYARVLEEFLNLFRAQ